MLIVAYIPEKVPDTYGTRSIIAVSQEFTTRPILG
jgi:hypothetical protein